MKPCISVIVPIYNVEKYIHKCVDSLLAQTYPHLEIILVDDGSPDGCPAICDAYAEKDGRVRVIHKENGGLSDARNAGLEIASGEYIGFVDSDDWIEPDMFEYLYNGMAGGAEISVCGVLEHRTYRIEIKNAPTDIVYTAEDALNEMFFDRMENYAWNKLYEARLWKDVRFPTGKNFEDVLTIYKTFERASRVAVLREAKYHYLIRPDSISGLVDFSNRLHIIEAFIDRYEDVAPRLPKYRPALFRRFRNWYMHELSRDIVEHPDRRGEALILLADMAPFVERHKEEVAADLHIRGLEKKKWDAFARGSIEGCRDCLKYHDKLRKQRARKAKLKKMLKL